MTEQEWLTCDDPKLMLAGLHGKIATSHRKRRLFVVACCRRVWHLLNDEQVRKAVDAAERYAEGRIMDDAVGKWSKKAAKARDGLKLEGRWPPEWLAYHAATLAAGPKRYSGSSEVPRLVIDAVASMTGQEKGDAAWNEASRREAMVLCNLLQDIVGDPFRPESVNQTWLATTVLALAQACYEDQAFDELPILGDALEDSGCDNAEILAHLRGPGPHVRGCWALDLILGKQ